METTTQQTAMQVSRNTIIGNVLLSAVKLFAGIFAGSAALLSDAVHSLSDVLSTIIVMLGIHLAGQGSDKEHPYGHERFECVAAIILAGLLFATGSGIGYNGIRSLLDCSYKDLQSPGLLALFAALISIVVKEAMYWYTKAAADKLHSGAMMADAWHHRSDALSSVGSFIGVLGARLGYPVLDVAACIIICLFIFKASYDIFMDAIGKMTDHACDDDTKSAIYATILAQKDVLAVDKLQTRLFGDKIYVDVEICADGNVTLSESHETAHRVHDAIEGAFPQVKHCMVHVNPYNHEEYMIS